GGSGGGKEGRRIGWTGVVEPERAADGRAAIWPPFRWQAQRRGKRRTTKRTNRKQRPIRRRQRGGASPTGRTPAGRSSRGSRGDAPPRRSQKRAFLEPIPCNAPRSEFMIMRRIDRGVLARAVGRGAPRPHRFRRMAPPLKHGRVDEGGLTSG